MTRNKSQRRTTSVMHKRGVLFAQETVLRDSMTKLTKDHCGSTSYTQDESCSESGQEANWRNPASAHFDEVNPTKESPTISQPQSTNPTNRTLLNKLANEVFDLKLSPEMELTTAFLAIDGLISNGQQILNQLRTTLHEEIKARFVQRIEELKNEK